MHYENIVFLFDSIFMFLGFIIIFTNSFYYQPKKRIFHYLLSNICIVSSLCYYSNFIDLGNIQLKNNHIVEMPRYIDWIITTPLQLVTLGNIGQISNTNIFKLCFIDILMILSGLLGEITENWVRFSFFAFGCLCFFPIYIFLFDDFDYDVVVEFAGEYTAKKYYNIGRYLLSVWFFYPLVWILINYNHISPPVGSICYSVLDFFSKCLFTFWIFLCSKNSHYLQDSQEEEKKENISLQIIE